MTPFLKDHAAALYQRRHLAAFVPFVASATPQFQPADNDCHRNVDIWCKLHPDQTPVRGWLLFEVFQHFGFFRFTAHSVVRLPDGTLFDLTPSRASQRYPFLGDHLTEEEYVLLVSSQQIVHLDHPVTPRSSA